MRRLQARTSSRFQASWFNKLFCAAGTLMIRRILRAIWINKSGPQNPAVPIYEYEYLELLDIFRIARERSGCLANHLKLSQVLDQPNFLASSFGHISVLPTGYSWPMHEDLPMLPLLQIRVSDLPHCPNKLRAFEYILIWCGIDYSPDMPSDLLNELFKMTSKNFDESKIQAFYERNADRISLQYSPEPSVVRVMTIPHKSPFDSCESQDPHEILKPHLLQIECITDSIDHWDGLYRKFLSSEMHERVDTLHYGRKLTPQQEKKIKESAGNHECIKVGGWPTNLQGVIDFDGEAEFVIQISSQKDSGLMLCDLGIIYIGYNSSTKKWISDWSCY